MALPDWSFRADYVATRSSRRSGDTDILPAWADEAFSDPEAVVIEPDYASRSGRSVRTIGMSFSAGFVITVITVVDEGRTWASTRGVPARRTSGTTWPATREGVVMGAKELIELESDAAEASRDLPEPDGVTGRRVKGGTVLSVRLNEEEFAALTALAQSKHIPTSTMARSLILQAMRGDAALASTVHDAVVTALREVLPKDLLAG